MIKNAKFQILLNLLLLVKLIFADFCTKENVEKYFTACDDSNKRSGKFFNNFSNILLEDSM